MRLRYRVSGILCLCALAQACTGTEQSTLGPSTDKAVILPQGVIFDDIIPAHRYTITVHPVRLARLGHASEFRVDIIANFVSPETRIDIVFPEVEVQKFASTQSALDKALPSAVTDRASLAQTVTRSIPVAAMFPKAGLYRIAVSARDERDTIEFRDGRPISNLEYGESWIYVDEAGAAFSDTIRPSLIPDSVIASPGPRRLRHAEERQGSMQVAPTRELRRPGPALEADDAVFGDCDQFRVFYYNGNTLSYQIAPGLAVTGFITEDWTGQEVGGIYTNTDPNGDFYVCTGPGYGYYGNVELQGNGFLFETPLAVGSFGGGESNGYYTELHVAYSGDTWLFLSLVKARVTAQTRFGYSRGQLKVKVLPGNDIKYSTLEDRVYLDRTTAFDTYYGWFSPGHEYGHAYHEKALGGIPGNNCPNPHYLDSLSSLSCAYTEGWADFFGAFVRGDLLIAGSGSDYRFEHNYYYPGTTGLTDGSRIEGAVAAFFYDLVDDSNSPDGPTNSSDGDDDATSYPASYLAQIIKTCQVRSGVVWIRPNGVDHVIYCMERSIDPAITGSATYFPTRSPDPSSFLENATEPVGWSQNAVRVLWKHNLYGE